MLPHYPSCLVSHQGQTWVSAAPLQLQRETCASSCLRRGPHEASSEVGWGHSQHPSIRKRWLDQASSNALWEAPDPYQGHSLFLRSQPMLASNMLCSQALSSASQTGLCSWKASALPTAPAWSSASGTHVKVRVLTVQLLLAPGSILFRSTPCVPVPVICFHRGQSEDCT